MIGGTRRVTKSSLFGYPIKFIVAKNKTLDLLSSRFLEGFASQTSRSSTSVCTRSHRLRMFSSVTNLEEGGKLEEDNVTSRETTLGSQMWSKLWPVPVDFVIRSFVIYNSLQQYLVTRLNIQYFWNISDPVADIYSFMSVETYNSYIYNTRACLFNIFSLNLHK